MAKKRFPKTVDAIKADLERFRRPKTRRDFLEYIHQAIREQVVSARAIHRFLEESQYDNIDELGGMHQRALWRAVAESRLEKGP